MKFLAYWQARLDKSHQEILHQAEEQGLVEKFPPDGVELLDWYLTPSDWGIFVLEADDVRAVDKAIKLWQANQPWFEEIKVEPAVTADERIESLTELFEAI